MKNLRIIGMRWNHLFKHFNMIMTTVPNYKPVLNRVWTVVICLCRFMRKYQFTRLAIGFVVVGYTLLHFRLISAKLFDGAPKWTALVFGVVQIAGYFILIQIHNNTLL